MSEKLLVPDLGEFENVEVIELLVKEGQEIKKNDPVATIESDKIILEGKKINFNGELKYHVYSFGKKYPSKKFYVIQRYLGGGMFSNLNYVLHHITKSLQLGCIPIIDMKNFPTKYNEKKKLKNTSNAWEYYFKTLNKYWSFYEDMYLNNYDPYEKPLHKLYKKYNCYSPIPSLALHVTNINSVYGLSPGINYKKFWENSKIK